jgi:hypothetical protein
VQIRFREYYLERNIPPVPGAVVIGSTTAASVDNATEEAEAGSRRQSDWAVLVVLDMPSEVLGSADVVASTLELSRAEISRESAAAAPLTGKVQSLVGVRAPSRATGVAVQGPSLQTEVPSLELIGLIEVNAVLGRNLLEQSLLILDGCLLGVGDGSGHGGGRSRKNEENVGELHDGDDEELSVVWVGWLRLMLDSWCWVVVQRERREDDIEGEVLPFYTLVLSSRSCALPPSRCWTTG